MAGGDDIVQRIAEENDAVQKRRRAGRPTDSAVADLAPSEELTASGQPVGVRNVKSAARAVEVLELLAQRDNMPSRLKDLSVELGVPKSSLYALLRTLVSRGWVRTDASGTLYAIGIRALLVGTSYLDTDPYVRIVRPHLDDLGSKLDETIHFGRLDGTDIVYLATYESTQYLRPYSRVGRRLPAFSTALGKSLLAERSEEEVERHLPAEPRKLTPYTVVDRDTLMEDLQAARGRGYAFDRQENTVGLDCIGFALRYANPPRDAISCSVPLARLTPERERDIIEVMQELRARIERQAPQLTAGGMEWL